MYDGQFFTFSRKVTPTRGMQIGFIGRPQRQAESVDDRTVLSDPYSGDPVFLPFFFLFLRIPLETGEQADRAYSSLRAASVALKSVKNNNKNNILRLRVRMPNDAPADGRVCGIINTCGPIKIPIE